LEDPDSAGAKLDDRQRAVADQPVDLTRGYAKLTAPFMLGLYKVWVCHWLFRHIVSSSLVKSVTTICDRSRQKASDKQRISH
jgi:hypothetical protein